MDFIVVLAIALNRLESQNPRRRHASDDVEQEMTKVFLECRDKIASTSAVSGAVAIDNSKGSSETIRVFSAKSDFAHMCCSADLVAASMFLHRLEEHEICHMVVSTGRGACWFEQPDTVQDECFEEDQHASYVCLPRWEV